MSAIVIDLEKERRKRLGVARLRPSFNREELNKGARSQKIRATFLNKRRGTATTPDTATIRGIGEIADEIVRRLNR